MVIIQLKIHSFTFNELYSYLVNWSFNFNYLTNQSSVLRFSTILYLKFDKFKNK